MSAMDHTETTLGDLVKRAARVDDLEGELAKVRADYATLQRQHQELRRTSTATASASAARREREAQLSAAREQRAAERIRSAETDRDSLTLELKGVREVHTQELELRSRQAANRIQIAENERDSLATDLERHSQESADRIEELESDVAQLHQRLTAVSGAADLLLAARTAEWVADAARQLSRLARMLELDYEWSRDGAFARAATDVRDLIGRQPPPLTEAVTSVTAGATCT